METTSQIKTNNLDLISTPKLSNDTSNNIKDDLIIINKDEEEEEKHYAFAHQLINYCAIPMVMKATIDMGVLRLIHANEGPNGLSSTEIAARLNLPNPNAPIMLDRMLRFLATYSILTCTTVSIADDGLERRYSPSPVTKFLVPNDDGVSLAGLLSLMIDKPFLESWTKLGEAVTTGGIPFNMVHGMHAFEYPNVDPRFNEVFNNAMYQTTTFIIKKILEKYKGLENIQQLVDVGGGLGHTLRIITSQYPSIKGINFDLPHVIQKAPPYIGVEHVSGDMFESVPNGDAIFMKWILHDWSDDHCLKLLKNCYKALPENGKVIVVEMIMTDEVATSDSNKCTSQLDVLMMTQNPGGKERSKQQFEALAKATGFSKITYECHAYNFWVMEFHK